MHSMTAVTSATVSASCESSGHPRMNYSSSKALKTARNGCRDFATFCRLNMMAPWPAEALMYDGKSRPNDPEKLCTLYSDPKKTAIEPYVRRKSEIQRPRKRSRQGDPRRARTCTNRGHGLSREWRSEFERFPRTDRLSATGKRCHISTSHDAVRWHANTIARLGLSSRCDIKMIQSAWRSRRLMDALIRGPVAGVR
jgi:hypothetical protein